MRPYALMGSYGTKGSICLSLLSRQIPDISSSIHRFLRIIYPWDSMHSWVAMAPRARYFYHYFAAKSGVSLPLFIGSSGSFIHEILCTRGRLWHQGLDICIIAFSPNLEYLFLYSSVPQHYLSLRFYALVGSNGTKGCICLSLLSCQVLDISCSIHWFLGVIYPWDPI